jgi:serine/threonine protein kinase
MLLYLYILLSIPLFISLLVVLLWCINKLRVWITTIRVQRKKEEELHKRLLRYDVPRCSDDEALEPLVKNKLQINLGQLTFLSKISEGAGGIVYRGLWYQQTVAIKRLKISNEESFIKEVSVLNSLRHPNVLELYGYSVDSKGYQYIVTEFMDKGSLDGLLYGNKLRNFETKIKSLLEIALGMSFLHERSIIYRDLKPQNILVNEKGVCKICDFGLAKDMNETLTVGIMVHGNIFHQKY